MRTIGAVVVVIVLAAGIAGSSMAAATPSAGCSKFASPRGSDRHAGTRTHPYRTPRRLARSLKRGQVGCLRGGTYGDYSTFTPIAASGVTLTSYPGETATLKGFLSVDGNSVIVRNLRIDGSNSYTNYPDKCGAQATGVMLDGHDILFEHNEVFQAGSTKGSAILQYGDRNIIRYNKLHDFGGCYAYDHGVYLENGDSVQIYGNWIWNNQHGWGIQVYPGPTNARIHDNVIDANGGGFVISDDGTASTTGNQIYRNVIVNSTGMTTQSGFFIAPAGLSGYWPVAGSNNSFTDNALFNNPVGESLNVTVADNLSVDPQFVDAAAHNYALAPSSPLAAWSLWNGR